jgi:uncharacterized protein (DUF2141 family)
MKNDMKLRRNRQSRVWFRIYSDPTGWISSKYQDFYIGPKYCKLASQVDRFVFSALGPSQCHKSGILKKLCFLFQP